MTDNELLLKLHELVKAERDLVTEVLRHLREVEDRKLFLARGYSSMFAFCTGALGYSEGEAHVRIQAMRLIKSMPVVEQKIESGEMSLSVAAQAQSCFRREKVQQADKAEILEELSGASTREAERKLAARFPGQAKREVERAVSDELTYIGFWANKEQMAKYNRLKGLLAHKNFEGRFDLLFEELADMALKKIDAPVLEAPQVPKRRTRYYSPKVRQIVFRRAGERCEYTDPLTGKRCDCRHGLQVDHILEFRNGGTHELANLRAYCGAHNRWRNFQ